MARTHVDRLLAFLQSQGGKATFAAIESEFGWDEAKADSVVAKSGNRIRRANLGRAAGVAQVGTEIGARGNVPLYADVRRVLATTWRRQQGWQAAMALDTALRGGRSPGVWTRPDCVLVFYPARRRRLDEKATLASFEIEAPDKFDIKSVYEAHAHGYGADFSWVVFFRDSDDPSEGPHLDWQRIKWAAGVCSVGLISVTNSGNASTWRVERQATRRDEGSRRAFVERAVPAARQDRTELTLEEMKARA